MGVYNTLYTHKKIVQLKTKNLELLILTNFSSIQQCTYVCIFVCNCVWYNAQLLQHQNLLVFCNYRVTCQSRAYLSPKFSLVGLRPFPILIMIRECTLISISDSQSHISLLHRLSNMTTLKLDMKFVFRYLSNTDING